MMVWLVIAAVVGLRFPRFVAFWLLLDVGWAVWVGGVTSAHLVNLVLAVALLTWPALRARQRRRRIERARREWGAQQWATR